jgi:hypothetical protein
MTQTDFEPSLSFVTLSDDGNTLLLNGEEKYSVMLPKNMFRKKAADRQKAIETTILNGCNSFRVDYVSEDNVKRRAKEIVDLLYERARVNSSSASKKNRDSKTKNSEKQQEQYEEEEVKLKKLYIQKYFSRSENVLYEAVLIAGKPYFVWQEWDGISGEPFIKLTDRILIPSSAEPSIELLPPKKEMYLSKPYEFASKDELNNYLKLAVNETFDTEYRKQKNLASKYIDANNTHLTILAADSIFTHFQDKLGQAHNDMFIGDNDTGKTANLVYLEYEGYRSMLDIDITPANIYGFLGTFEEDQGIILEDEADDISNNAEKMKIYKAGYNAGKKVTRTEITSFGRKMQSYNTFCFKAFTAEEAPDSNKAKGFIDRTFIFHCARGSPPYDIQEVTNPAGDSEHTALLNELIHNRKVLFAFRMLHYQDPLPNIELSVINREKQLCKPVLRLFQDSECTEEIGTALADMIAQKRGIKRDTLEAKILDVVNTMIIIGEKEQAQQSLTDNNRQYILLPLKPNQIPSASLYEKVCQELNGEYRRKGEKSFETEEHGIVSHDKIRKICIDKFGAEPKRTSGARFLEFSAHKLEKAKAAYEFPDKVVILQNKKSHSSGSCIMENDNENNNESTNDANDTNDADLEYTQENETIPDSHNQQEVVNNSLNGHEKMKEPEQTREEGASKNDEKGPLYSETLSSLSPSPWSSSITTLHQNQVSNLISKVMKDNQGNGNNGYFTKDDWVFTCQMWPNLHWTEDQAEQVLHALLEKGMVEELGGPGSGKFVAAEKLSFESDVVTNYHVYPAPVTDPPNLQ